MAEVAAVPGAPRPHAPVPREFGRVFRRLLANRRVVLGGAVLLFFALAAALAPLLAPHDPVEQDLLLH